MLHYGDVKAVDFAIHWQAWLLFPQEPHWPTSLARQARALPTMATTATC